MKDMMTGNDSFCRWLDVLFCSVLLLLLFTSTTAKAASYECHIDTTKIVEDKDLYGTKYKIPVFATPTADFERKVSVLITFMDDDKRQKRWIGDAKILAGEQYATATVDVYTPKQNIDDGRYGIYCMPKFDLLPDKVEETPCDKQDMIVLYKGLRLNPTPGVTENLKIEQCSETIGLLTDNSADRFVFRGGYPEKKGDTDKHECVCASYIDTDDGEPLKDCSTAFVRFIKKDNSPDFPLQSPYPNPPQLEYLEDGMQVASRIISFHSPIEGEGGNCKPVLGCDPPITFKIIKRFDKKKPDPPQFSANLLNEGFFDHKTVWAIYDITDSEAPALINFPTAEENQKGTDTIVFESADKSSVYRVEARVYLKRKGCVGEDHYDYITSLDNYVNFMWPCDNVDDDRVPALAIDSEPVKLEMAQDEDTYCFRVSKAAIAGVKSNGFSVHLNGPENI